MWSVSLSVICEIVVPALSKVLLLQVWHANIHMQVCCCCMYLYFWHSALSLVLFVSIMFVVAVVTMSPLSEIMQHKLLQCSYFNATTHFLWQVNAFKVCFSVCCYFCYFVYTCTFVSWLLQAFLLFCYCCVYV